MLDNASRKPTSGQRYSMPMAIKSLDPDMTSQELIESASGLLSEFTRMAGLVTLPKRGQVMLRHVEFLSLEDNRVLVIFVLDDQLLVIIVKITFLMI